MEIKVGFSSTSIKMNHERPAGYCQWELGTGREGLSNGNSLTQEMNEDQWTGGIFRKW